MPPGLAVRGMRIEALRATLDCKIIGTTENPQGSMLITTGVAGRNKKRRQSRLEKTRINYAIALK